jgi:FdhE protein
VTAVTSKVKARIGDPTRDVVGQPEPIILPDPPGLFARRAARLTTLADGHSMADWLRFVARVAQAQAAIAAPVSVAPDLAAIERDVAARMPPLAADGHTRDDAWRGGLAILLTQVAHDRLPPAALATLDRLRHSDSAAIEALADDWLRGTVPSSEAGAALFVAAALQAWFARHAAALPVAALRLLPQRGLCPVCGSAPVAGVITAAGRAPGARYLHCGLCATAWNHVRAVCINCGDSRSLVLRELEGGTGAVKAETCDACHGYAKMLYQEHDMAVDAMADDLASLGLDIKLSDAGWSRHAPNPLILAS